jgi:hypothetical protein
LVEVLLQAEKKNRVNHKKGNGTVVSRMKDDFGDDFCIGVMDEDREPLNYLRDQCDIKIANNYLKLWKHKEKHHYVIQIRPVIEKWIMAICEEGKINLKDYKLPDVWRDLVKISKSVSSKEDQRFIGLFKEMKRRKVGPVLQLQRWLEHLKAKTYNADINQLINA